MKANSSPIFVYTALPCEAKPLIDFFRLKKDTSIHCFAVYTNQNIYLTVTGIGKNAMAAGVSYSQALFSPPEQPIMLNIGIAGHKNHPIGKLFLVDKITDNDTDRRYYPPLVFTPPCPTHGLQTSSKPQLAYPPIDLCDMEAAAFYETAVRFSTSEFIHCLKIVSDNESSPVHNIQASQVSSLMAAHVTTIETILSVLTKLADSQLQPELNNYNQIVAKYRFTVNEQIQLKKLLARWRLLKNGDVIVETDNSPTTGKGLLNLLNQSLIEAEFYL